MIFKIYSLSVLIHAIGGGGAAVLKADLKQIAVIQSADKAIALYGNLKPGEKRGYVTWYILARAYTAKKQYKQAEKALSYALKARPDDFSGYLLLGKLQRQMQDPMQSIATLKKAVLLNPDCYECNFELGLAYSAIFHYEKAVAMLAVYLQRYPQDLTAALALAWALESSGQLDQAMSQYEKILALHDDVPTAQINLARLLDIQGNVDGARALFVGVLQRHPQEGLAAYNLGVIAQREHDWAVARSYYEQAKSSPHASAEIFNNLGVVEQQLGDLTKAADNFEIAIARKNNFLDAYFNLSLLHYQQKKYQQAKKELLHILQLSPHYQAAEKLLNDIYVQEGALVQSVDILKDLASDSSEDL